MAGGTSIVDKKFYWFVGAIAETYVGVGGERHLFVVIAIVVAILVFAEVGEGGNLGEG